MDRRIQKHSTRLSAAHEGALDAGYHVGQRVRTLDGYLGRVVMITESFSPGVDEYQIILDNGMGGGTYIASQLRPVPEDYGGGHQAPAYLPAGVTAALEAEAELQALASDDYPEMGTILHDRPDPGGQITVIGALARPFDDTWSTDHNQTYHPGPMPRLYHGTNAELGEGHYVEPGYPTHYQGAYDGMEEEASTRVHATPHVEQAWQHADNAVHEHGGTHHVYEVEPTGKVTWGDEAFPEDYESDDEMNEHATRMSQSPFRVRREVPYNGEPLPFTQRHQAAAGWSYDSNIMGRILARSPEGDEHELWTRGMGLRGIRHPEDMPAPLYHGSDREFAPGEQIEPGHPGNFVSRMKHVYMTEQPESDEGYKGARGYGRHVYEVQPTDWYGHRRDARGAEWATEGPLNIVRKVPDPRHLAAFYADEVDPREQDYNGEPEVGGVFWGAPAQQQFVDEELGQPEPGPVEMVGPVEPGSEVEPGEEAEPGEEEEPDEGEGEEEPPPFGAEASLRDDKSDRWHEYNQQFRPDTLHRGIHIQLPDHLHDYVHDDSQPREDRARALAGHFAGGLGRHWTPHTQIAHRAIWNAADAGHGLSGGQLYYRDDPDVKTTDVMFHVKRPGRRNEVRDPGQLEQHDVGWAYSKDEDETFLREGAPLKLEGISWKPHETEYPNEPFEHHDFAKPIRHTAMATDWNESHAKVPEEIHRGLYAPESHGVFSAPMSDEDIAHGLVAAHQEEHFPYRRDRDQLFGTHWTSDEDVARGFAHEHERAHFEEDDQCPDHDEHFEARPVVFHAQRPQRHEIEDDPRRLGWQNVDDYDTHEKEVPIKHGAPVRLTGVSWLMHTGLGPMWHRHDFREPVELRAEDRDSPSDPNKWNASLRTARVPWTGEEREQLHSWQEHPTATEGDFVDSRQFTNKYPEPEPGPDPEMQFAEMVGPRAFAEMTAARVARPEQDDDLSGHPPHGQAADEVYAQLSKKFPPKSIAWVHDAQWEGPHRVPLGQVDFSNRDSWDAQPGDKKVRKFRKKITKKEKAGKDPKPAILVSRPGKPDPQVIADGHHRAIAEEELEAEDPGREGLYAWTAHVPEDEGPWDHMHSAQEPDQGDALDEPGEETGPPGADADADSLEFGDPSATQPYPPPVTTGLPPYSQSGTPGPRTKNYTPVQQSPAFLLAHPELQQHSEPPPGEEDEDGDVSETGDTDGGEDTGKALGSFEKAAGSASFRFEFTASWADVVAKAERIVRENGVRITMLAGSLTAGEVKGDHATYETGLQYYPGRGFSVMAYSCGCPWATFWQNPDQPGRFAGRMCSHAYALGLAAKARGVVRRTMFPELGGWPEQVVVKSEPPWHPSDKQWAWQQTGPMTRVPVLSSLIPAGILVGQVSAIPAVTAARVLVDAGEDPAAVTILLRLAGMHVEADQANAPWGSQDVTSMPPAKPYGATSPPEYDRDPGSYGPLSGPDPDNWGEIQDDSAIQMPLTNEAARRSEDPNVLDSPDTLDWADDPGQTLPYQDPGDTGLQASASGAIFLDNQTAPAGSAGQGRYGKARQGTGPVLDTEASRVSSDLRTMDTNTGPVTNEWGESFPPSGQAPAAGSSTSIEPRDPQGIRMEEALAAFSQQILAELKDEPEPALDPEGLTAEESPGSAWDNRHSGTYSTADGYNPESAEGPYQFGEPGLGSLDEPSVPGDSSIQTQGTQQWSGGDYSSGDLASPENQGQQFPAEDEDLRDIVAAFQRSAAARQYTGDGAVQADGDIAAAARAYLQKEADVLPPDEADELIREGRGARARNLDLLDLRGTHYSDHPELDEHDDDIAWA
jgi:hypothetical protein